ncbi:CheR family methyltransferase [Sphingomonas aracearum]|uniref:protein-glutamate O-methyltransferase n=1 Tax=Sphingomonas aracearum TaxID=2283317 RepID=A0A369VU98_9SPHN|nr:protein-glutamate O-methyltransferase CheR [Sphingomonas aracearum]RDE05225.1 protein-glutamate O-methyltransferase CheR [Sphingomonas aracearum]
MLTPTAPRRGAINVFAALLEQRTGQQIAANREWLVETALKPLMRARGLASLDALVAALVGGAEPALAEQVVDALLNQETSFFRDAGVLDMVADAVKSISDESAISRRPRIWSAACSTGQEPLSLAMALDERQVRAEIIATDVSEAALVRARAGRFSQFEIQRGLPVRRMVSWFESDGGDWVASPDLVRRIQFRRLNLVGDPLPFGRFDVILCRNVLLYLSPSLRRTVLDRLALSLRPGGLLVLGAGETVIGQTEAFRPSARWRGLYEPSLAHPIPLGRLAR